ncbi:MAG: hypothetical protein OXH81_23505 [Gemmatimonadetes bacterium]|nr:hypothetical protein [Gemmatimonadota bacterium]
MGCEVNPPQIPSTNFQISIPVADDRTTVQDLADERPGFLKIDDEGLLAVDFTADFNHREEVGDRLRVAPVSAALAVPIGPADGAIAKTEALAFGDDRIQIAHAVIAEGGLTFKATNQTAISLQIELVLDDVKRPDGTPPTFLIDALAPGESKTVLFDLAGDELAPQNPLELRFSYRVQGEFAEAATNELLLEVETEDLLLSRVEGVLNEVILPVVPVARAVNFPAGLDQIAFNSVALEVDLTSGIGFRSRIDFHIAGTNGHGERGSLTISETFQRGDPDRPVSLALSLASAELTEFLNLLPTEVAVSPTVRIGDGESVEVIDSSHWVQIDHVRFATQGYFQLKENTRIEFDPIFRRLQDDNARRRIHAGLDSAVAVTAIENHLPTAIRVSLWVAPRAEDVYGSEDLFTDNEANGYLRIPKQGSLAVGAGEVGPEGQVVTSAFSHQRIALSDEDVEVFLQEEGVYTGMLVELDRTPSEVVMRGSDFVAVEAGAVIFMEFNEDLVK